jgi:hypothetical protein
MALVGCQGRGVSELLLDRVQMIEILKSSVLIFTYCAN